MRHILYAQLPYFSNEQCLKNVLFYVQSRHLQHIASRHFARFVVTWLSLLSNEDPELWIH